MIMKPKVISDATYAFPANVIGELLPEMEDIPEEFKGHNATPWHKIQSRWFFSGLPENSKWYPKEGIDPELAVRHLSACQRSFEPQHEHKEAGVAYLMSLWFERIEFPDEKEVAS